MVPAVLSYAASGPTVSSSEMVEPLDTYPFYLVLALSLALSLA